MTIICWNSLSHDRPHGMFLRMTIINVKNTPTNRLVWGSFAKIASSRRVRVANRRKRNRKLSEFSSFEIHIYSLMASSYIFALFIHIYITHLKQFRWLFILKWLITYPCVRFSRISYRHRWDFFITFAYWIVEIPSYKSKLGESIGSVIRWPLVFCIFEYPNIRRRS